MAQLEIIHHPAEEPKKGFFTKKKLLVAATVVFTGYHLVGDAERALKTWAQEDVIDLQQQEIQILQRENAILKDALGIGDGQHHRAAPRAPMMTAAYTMPSKT